MEQITLDTFIMKVTMQSIHRCLSFNVEKINRLKWRLKFWLPDVTKKKVLVYQHVLERYCHRDEREPVQALLKIPLGVPGEPEILWRVSHPRTIQAQCSLTLVFK